MAQSDPKENSFVIYQTENGDVKVDVFLDDETLWLTQKGMAALFGVVKSTVSEHLSNIFRTGELQKEATVRKFRTVQQESKRKVNRTLEYYNLDAIISVGYRVNSSKANKENMELTTWKNAQGGRILKSDTSSAKKAIMNQIVRSGTSVGANYRAACRARSDREFIAKMNIVLEEADECCFWLEIIQEKKWENIEDLLKEANELTAIFVTTLKSMNRKRLTSKI